jgi:hypothetical protein
LRRIPLSRRSHITGFQPLPTGTAEHESALERDFVARTSLIDPAASIISQPLTLRFSDGLRTRRYTPDFLVRGSNGRSRLIEVKYRADLRLRWDQYRPAFAAARVWAHEQGAAFRVVTEHHIRDIALDNAKRLAIVRTAAARLGGTVRITDGLDGRGCTFFVQFSTSAVDSAERSSVNSIPG